MAFYLFIVLKRCLLDQIDKTKQFSCRCRLCRLSDKICYFVFSLQRYECFYSNPLCGNCAI